MTEKTGPENLDFRWLGAAEALLHFHFKVASKRCAVQSGHAGIDLHAAVFLAAHVHGWVAHDVLL